MVKIWILLIASTIWISLLAFFWALATGQFSDQNRARYLPFAGERGRTVGGTTGKFALEKLPWKGKERYVFLVLTIAFVIVSAAAFFLGLTAG